MQKELGSKPQNETRQLYKIILEQKDTFIDTSQHWIIPEISRPHHNLPAQSIPIIPRDDIMPDIQKRLEDPACRLLSLIGPGG